MSTLTYCKGLPTPENELNALGFTKFEMFLTAYSKVFKAAEILTVQHLQSGQVFSKSHWNTHLQTTFGINKRHANGVISSAKGRLDGAKEHRSLHIKTLEGKIKSLEVWIKKALRKITLAQKFYAKKDWHNSKVGCNLPLSCSLKFRDTSWQNLKFQLHGKQRKLYLFQNKLRHLKLKPVQVVVPNGNLFVVGSKDETFGNGVCQWDGKTITFRVPKCLEAKFGQKVSTNLGGFDRTINRIPSDSARTWHFYRKDGKWVVALQFTPSAVTQQSKEIEYGCIGIDMNPGSIGWAYVDTEGNLKHHGKIPLQMGLPTGMQQAQIVDACLQLVALAITFQCPIVCEELDFADKKERLGETSRRYARMLSSWAYSEFYKQLGSITSNRGIDLKTVNAAYTSIIGLVKYMKMYGLSSDTAAAIAIARRGMKLYESIPDSITAYFEVNSEKHVWSQWNQLNKQIKQSGITRRHDYYAISNWSFLANPEIGEAARH
jgi:IS605 OrfB family transposase